MASGTNVVGPIMGRPRAEVDVETAPTKYGFNVSEQKLYEEISRARHQMEFAEATRTPGCDDLSLKLKNDVLRAFDVELDRVIVHIAAQQKSRQEAAKALLDEIDQDVATNTVLTVDKLKKFRKRADKQVQKCYELEDLTAKCTQALEQIANRADQDVGTPCQKALKRTLKTVNNTSLIAILSDLYEAIRMAEKTEQVEHKTWKAPTTFERTTRKYWVEEDKLTTLLIAASTEAPLLVYGKTGRLTSQDYPKNITENDMLWKSLASPVASVYFDSPNMDLYRDRIKRVEGANLLRARWYGKNIPKGNEHIFLELKTHHESWICDKSVKERVTILEKDMKRVLSREVWTDEVAKVIVRAATPTLKGKALDESAALLGKMHDMVIKLDLRACVRSTYFRAAFQSSGSNDLRLTVDRHVTLVDETASWKMSSWCLPDNTELEPQHIVRIPFPVYEIKLAGSDMPTSMSDLIQAGVLTEADKFSKFLTGAAAFHQKQLNMLPYWANHPSFSSLLASKTAHTVVEETEQQNPNLRQRRAIVSDTSSSTEAGSTSSSRDQRSNSLRILPRMSFRQAERPEGSFRFKGLSWLSAMDSDLTKGSMAQTPIPGLRIAPKQRVKVEPKTYFANERTFIQWISAALLLVTVALILLETNDDESGHVLATLGAVMNGCALFVAAYAAYVYFRRVHLIKQGKAFGYADYIGPTILTGAVFLGVVTLFVIALRIRNLNPYFAHVIKSDGNGRCVLHSPTGVSKLEFQPSDVLSDSDSNFLLVSSHDEIMTLSKTNPNGEAVNVATIDFANITALTMVDGTVFAVNNFETTTSSKSSKTTATTELVVMEWNNGKSKLNVHSKWDLQVPRSEAITYVPDMKDSGGSGSLYVAGEGGSIYIYPLPKKQDLQTLAPTEESWLSSPATSETTSLSNPILFGKKPLNRNLLVEGLLYPNIAAMQYFEDRLYVLHNRERLVRVWDIHEGTLSSEWMLPSVGRRFNTKWVGMFLERTGDDSGGSSENSSSRLLRGLKDGGGGSSLTLHLALDTPGQVWSLKVKEDVTKKGKIVLPGCAASS